MRTDQVYEPASLSGLMDADLTILYLIGAVVVQLLRLASEVCLDWATLA